MSQRKITLRLNKIVSILILLTTLVLTYCYYGNTYSISDDRTRLATSISNYIFSAEVEADVLLMQKENDWMYVLFTDSKYGDSFKGLARLKRGWNGKYTIYGADYGSGYPISIYYFANRKGTLAAYGMFPDDRAVRYEYVNDALSSIQSAEYSGTISNKVFIHICNDGEPNRMGLHIYDRLGEDITRSYHGTVNAAPSGGTATAELFMVDIYCGIFLLIGSILAMKCWRRKQLNNQSG